MVIQFLHGRARPGQKRNTYRTYTCANHNNKREKKCNTKSINADYLETAVKEAVTAYINKVICIPQYNKAIATLIKTKIKHDCGNLKNRIDVLAEEAKALLIRASKTSSELLIDSYEQEANEHLETKNELEKELEILQTTNENILEEVQQYCLGKKKFTADTLFIDRETTKMLIYALVKRIDVDDKTDTITITFNE